MKRLMDIIFALIALILFSELFIILFFLVRITSSGPALYWSDRVGKDNVIFKMPKFRTMIVETPALATHLLHNPNRWLTPIGSFMRRASLDELPQIWSILKGDMSFVGPRPALFNQTDLISLRTAMGINKLLPGLTGWAQINGRDELEICEKVKLDLEYMYHQSLLFDLKIIFLTISKLISCNDISH